MLRVAVPFVIRWVPTAANRSVLSAVLSCDGVTQPIMKRGAPQQQHQQLLQNNDDDDDDDDATTTHCRRSSN